MIRYEDLTGRKKNRVDELHRAIGRKVYKIAWTKPDGPDHRKSRADQLESLFEKIEIVMQHRNRVHFITLKNDYIVVPKYRRELWGYR